jgi:geranylgeranyl pyrophosphate synthase
MARCLGRENLEDFEANKDIYFSCGMTELIHNGSLMVDDIQDASEQRRGEPCTYKKFGTDIAINAGNFMYFSPMLKMNQYVTNKDHALAIH